MLTRFIKDRLLELLGRYPAVALLEPRQCGKTTLARMIPGQYFDLESEQDRLRLDVEWNVLGSVSPALMRQGSQSLTGRLALCELTPFLLSESQVQPDRLWLTGGYPDGGVLDPGQFPEWQHNYLALMSQRDLPNWGLTARPVVTMRLFRMLAAVHGQLWNASQIGKSLGLSYHSVNAYVDFLEQAYLLRRLPAYSANIRKRLVRSPKLYWRDSGLLHALLDTGTDDDLLVRPWVGASWEGWIIEQLLSRLSSAGRTFQAYHPAHERPARDRSAAGAAGRIVGLRDQVDECAQRR
ncbi:MAG: ATP-binding protein [Gemmatimonadetes bacterium]|jgi:uncharacterized protein|nr:ATP-binding protein [Gemmatimonadota bacterium]